MRDSRRRRIIFREEAESVAEEPLSAPHGSTGSKEVASDRDGVSADYTSGALISNQPKMIDFVPQRLFAVTAIGMILLATVILLNFAHSRVLPFAQARNIPADSIELSSDQGLICWVSSFLFLATAFFCFQVFQVRRFRADDFNGTYRVWAWLAFGFILVSIDATARLSPLMAGLVATCWKSGWMADPNHVWLVMVALPALLIVVRMTLEIRRSRTALGLVSFAAACYFIANALRMGLLNIPASDPPVVESNAYLIANCGLYFAVVWYSRFVLLESQMMDAAMVVIPTSAAESEDRIDSRRHTKKAAKKSAVKENRKLRDKTEAVSADRSESTPAQGQRSEESDQTSDDDNDSTELMGQVIHKMPSRRKKSRPQKQRRRAA